MAKGIFALEDLEDTDLAVEPVNEVDYIQAQNDLDDHSDVIDNLQEVYDNADQDSSVIGAVADSIPYTDEPPVESTIIATEALIRKLGLPNYSLESYKDKTNKALRASLEETVSNTQEAKKSLFKKIWEKIVAFFKKAYEFFTGLFKRKTSDVKKKVDDLKTNNVEEAIKEAETNVKKRHHHQETTPNSEDHNTSKLNPNSSNLTEEIADLFGLTKKDGGYYIDASIEILKNLFIEEDDPYVTFNAISKALDIFINVNNDFKPFIVKLKNIELYDTQTLQTLLLDIKKADLLLNHKSKIWFYGYDEEKKKKIADAKTGKMEVISKSQLSELTNKITKLNSELVIMSKTVIEFQNLDNLAGHKEIEKRINYDFDGAEGVKTEHRSVAFKVISGLASSLYHTTESLKKYSVGSLNYVNKVSDILKRIENAQ